MISERLTKIIISELGLPAFELTEQMLATEVPGWDSLSHVRILAAVERELGIKFKALETLRLKNIGDLQALVDKKLKG